MKWLTTARAAGIAAALAVLTFFFILDYFPRAGIIGNAMTRDTNLAGIVVPYRWVLAWLTVFVGAVAVWRWTKAP